MEDLGSVNGTLLNGERIKGIEWVRPGDNLTVGPVTFVVEYETPDDEVLDAEEVEVADEKVLPIEEIDRRVEEITPLPAALRRR